MKKTGRRAEPEIVRFMRFVRKTRTCWLWIGSTTRGGYGQFRGGAEHSFKMFKAHRFAYEQFVGSVPVNKDVMHKCDVANCVRPLHLELGTALENNRQIWMHGRGHKSIGTHNGMFGKRPWNKGISWLKNKTLAQLGLRITL